MIESFVGTLVMGMTVLGLSSISFWAGREYQAYRFHQEEGDEYLKTAREHDYWPLFRRRDVRW
jgi:hypothetical protein